ncbi:MAG: biotin--[acetyl-CoA-carboxylase] ligase [Clostridia bacterium]|nr:biotin--[acetyl-CoA-carboxylase] ligase [Clostridia bacterium]
MNHQQIDASEIEARLTEAARVFYHVTVEDELTSTNTTLKQMAAEDAASDGSAPNGTVLIARRQTGGRGRLGRTFHSPSGSGLYMSVLVRPNDTASLHPLDEADCHTKPQSKPLIIPSLHASDALYLTTGTAAAVAKAIDTVRIVHAHDAAREAAVSDTSASPAKIKWVNDIYLSHSDGIPKKVCGILCEAALRPGTTALSYAVIGIGVNLLPPPDGFPPDIAKTATSVFTAEEEALCDGNDLAVAILNLLYPLFTDPKNPDYQAEYRSRSLLDGKRIFVRPSSSLGGAEIPATALGLDEEMGLLVRYDNGEEAVLRSGEVIMQDDSVVLGGDSVHLLR